MSFRRVTRSSQPPDIIHPDRSNRLLAGCTHLFSYTRINLITNEIPAYPASIASGLLVPTSQGLGFNYNSTGSPYWAATTAANQINASNPWTTACLVQFFDTAATPISMVVNAIDSTTRDRGLSIIAGSQVEGYLFDGGAQTIVSPNAIVAGRVYNIVLSAGGGNFTLYIDGVQVATKAVANNGYNGYVTQPIFSLGHGSNASATSTGTATLLMLLKTDNVYWGAAQAAEFYRNPWQVFLPPKVLRYGTTTASGAISGTTILTFGQTGAIAGTGALAGTTSLTFGQTGNLTGTGILAGSTALTFGQTGALIGTGILAGTIPLVFGQTGILTPPAGALNGQTNLTFGLSGTLTATGVLAGTTTLTFGASATFDTGIVQYGNIGPLSPSGRFPMAKGIGYDKPKLKEEVEEIEEEIEKELEPPPKRPILTLKRPKVNIEALQNIEERISDIQVLAKEAQSTQDRRRLRQLEEEAILLMILS